MSRNNRPHTPDGRYLVSKGVLKRCTDPMLDDKSRRRELKALIRARMSNNHTAARTAKEALGEVGAVWWTDGAPDVSGLAPSETAYADWWVSLSEAQRKMGL